MIILSLDTAMSACSAALYDSASGHVLAEKHEPMNRGQAERLVPMIDEIIKQAKCDYQDIDLIACTHGPGAFTGLRLSLATAKALSLSLEIPAIGISTLEAIVHSYPASLRGNEMTEANQKKEDWIASSPAAPRNDEYNCVMVALETKRKDYYIQIFNKDKKPMSPPEAASAGKIEQYIKEYSPVVCGDANKRLLNEIETKFEYHDILYADCGALAKLVAEKYDAEGDRLQQMEPLYLRDADISFPATKK